MQHIWNNTSGSIMEQSKIKDFYNSNSWIKPQLKDYVFGNKRIDRCVELFEKYVEKNNKKNYTVCDIGCSIGVIPNILSYKFKNIQIDALDISEDQIRIARKLFCNENIKFSVIDLTKDKLKKEYDIFTLFDVLEHLPPESYTAVFTNIARSIKSNGKIIITVPSSYYNSYLYKEMPDALQVIDEIITYDKVEQVAKIVGGTIIYYNLISVWKKYDYAHYIISMDKPLIQFNYAKKKYSYYYKVLFKLGLSKRDKKIAQRKKEVDILFKEI